MDASLISELCNFDPSSLRIGKKSRGRKRRLRRLLREAEAFTIDPVERRWFNLWHYHLDHASRNFGHRRWRYRLEAFGGLSAVFNTIARAKEKFPIPFQLWISLSGRDPVEDAVYLHTPNPHTEFPLQLGVESDWNDSRLLPIFQEMLPDYRLRIGRTQGFDLWADPPRTTTSFSVYSPDVGIPLER